MDKLDGTKLYAKQIELIVDNVPPPPPPPPTPTKNRPVLETQKLKLYNMTTLPQKIQLWLIVLLSLLSLLSNFASIVSSFGLFPNNRSCSESATSRKLNQ